MQIEKFISYQIERQFPALYRENGKELVDFVKAYFEFLETQTNQSIYNSRRLFEYRDIDNTLDQLVIFFRNKYLADLPLNENTVRITVKKILDLYRRKGNKESIELFFKTFYDESVEIFYPSKSILKPSDSKWSTQKYLQLFSTDPSLFRDIVNKRIFGTISKAEAIVEKAFFMMINGTFTPIIFISDVEGNFVGFDNIVYKNDTANFVGVVYGSMNSVEIVNDLNYVPTSGNKVGDILTIQDEYGSAGKLLVTGVSETFSGEIIYKTLDGGWGFSKEHTLLLVSNQIIFLNEQNPRKFEPFDVISDQLGNSGFVIGQRQNVLGVKMDETKEFVSSSVLVDSSNTVIDFDSIVPKNDSSPGPLFPEAEPSELDYAAALDSIQNIELFASITDKISDYFDVTLDSSNYNVPPALKPMSGNTDPVDINTSLDTAFSIEDIEIGSIISFKNANPGFNYINDVFAIAYDPMTSGAERYNQIISFDGSTNLFSIDEEIQQGAVIAKIVDIKNGKLYVRPYSMTGILPGLTFTHRGAVYNITAVDVDYNSSVAGYNASVSTITDFAIGKITDVKVTSSGYGYIDQSVVSLIDAEGKIAARGRIDARGQGESEGSWSTFSSHIGQERNKVIQDSYYYQDYSYEIQSKIDINKYEQILKDNIHVAGTKVFGKFSFSDLASTNTRITLTLEE